MNQYKQSASTWKKEAIHYKKQAIRSRRMSLLFAGLFVASVVVCNVANAATKYHLGNCTVIGGAHGITLPTW